MAAQLEIERKFVLTALPSLPEDARPLQLLQGYLTEDQAAGPLAIGRLRRETAADGPTRYLHTIKTGAGLVREEREREISAAEFASAWPRTEGARLQKTRYRIDIGPVEWAIDDFADRPLVLAEAEMPTEDTELAIPDWLAPLIDREVTGDPAYDNARLARSGS